MMTEIPKQTWQNIRPKGLPFLNHAFMEALKTSGCIGSEAGWEPIHFLNTSQDAALYTFAKNHSYGEYIFDWSWAQAYQKYGVPYYPKLTSMIPFTPATTNHFLMPVFDEKKATELLGQHDQLLRSGDFSSAHFLFLSSEEIPFFKRHGYAIRESLQYHFFNEGYEDFPHFLSFLKGRKAKQIRSERLHPDLEIHSYTKDELTLSHARQMYQFYISTIELKHSQDYLNEAFFLSIFQNMKENILYIEASDKNSPVAGSLFFYDDENLYGRYWGSHEFYEKLHFELCYYQGIDFCLKHKLKKFEAGAQGEHKIARGFRPIRTFSAHKILHPGFQKAIEDFIESEKAHLDLAIRELSQNLPFRL